MRYPASEKLEIIRIVEQSHLPVKKTLDQFGTAWRANGDVTTQIWVDNPMVPNYYFATRERSRISFLL